MKALNAEIQAVEAQLQEIGQRQSRRRNVVSSPHAFPEDDAGHRLATTGATSDRDSSADFHYKASTPRDAPHTPAKTVLQLPGEKKSRQGIVSPPGEPTFSPHRGQYPVHFTPPPSARPVSSPPASPPFARHSSARYSISPQQLSDGLRRLEAQVQRINELSAVQEAAMLELKAIAEQVEHDQTTLKGDDVLQGDRPTLSVCEYLPTAVPKVERDVINGAYVITARSIDLLKKEHEAEQAAISTAETVRRFANRSAKSAPPNDYPPSITTARKSLRRSSPKSTSIVGLILEPLTSLVSSVSSRRRTDRVERATTTDQVEQADAAETPELPSLDFQEAILWIAGSAVVRIGLDALLAAFPAFWLPVLALIVTPTAIAIYRTTIDPRSGLILGYRLLLIMVGLLLGGRL
ncbi:MAG TPA: hypothetical protein ACFE0H_12505 [Elainellaceae cyanobacterium]